MSISGPASSRWSARRRAARLADRTEHRVRVGGVGARAGSAALISAASSSASTAASSCSSSLLALADLAHPRDRRGGVLARALGGRDLLGARRSWPPAATRARAGPRAGGRRARRPRRAAPPAAAPRRASAARTASGCSRISLRSRTAGRPSREQDAPLDPIVGVLRRLRAGVLREELRDRRRAPGRRRCSGA